MLNVAVAVTATFLLLPHAEAHTASFINELVMKWYGAAHLENLLLFWRLLLAVLIFALVRACLTFVLSAASLALAMRVLGRARRR